MFRCVNVFALCMHMRAWILLKLIVAVQIGPIFIKIHLSVAEKIQFLIES